MELVGEALVEHIGNALFDTTGQYREVVDAANHSRVDVVRSCGRKAGRRRQVRVQTFVSPLNDGACAVWVVNVQRPEAHDDLGQLRMRKRLRATVEAASEGF